MVFVVESGLSTGSDFLSSEREAVRLERNSIEKLKRKLILEEQELLEKHRTTDSDIEKLQDLNQMFQKR